MGMVFTHGIADDTGAFPVRAVIADAQLIHIIEGSALHRLKPVPHIRQSPGNDDAHGIVNVGFLHEVRIFRAYNLFFHNIFYILLPLDVQLRVAGVLVDKCPSRRHLRAHQHLGDAGGHTGVLDLDAL